MFAYVHTLNFTFGDGHANKCKSAFKNNQPAGSILHVNLCCTRHLIGCQDPVCRQRELQVQCPIWFFGRVGISLRKPFGSLCL